MQTRRGGKSASLRQMRILVSEPDLVDDLVAFLRRCECAADRVGSRVVDAVPPHPSVGFEYLRMELDSYLRVWREMHPGVTAELLEARTALA
jgi:hypothetical protein